MLWLYRGLTAASVMASGALVFGCNSANISIQKIRQYKFTIIYHWRLGISYVLSKNGVPWHQLHPQMLRLCDVPPTPVMGAVFAWTFSIKIVHIFMCPGTRNMFAPFVCWNTFTWWMAFICFHLIMSFLVKTIFLCTWPRRDWYWAIGCDGSHTGKKE